MDAEKVMIRYGNRVRNLSPFQDSKGFCIVVVYDKENYRAYMDTKLKVHTDGGSSGVYVIVAAKKTVFGRLEDGRLRDWTVSGLYPAFELELDGRNPVFRLRKNSTLYRRIQEIGEIDGEELDKKYFIRA